MQLMYLASPYSDPDPDIRFARYRKVCYAASKLLQAGTMCFSPIAHTHSIAMEGALPTDFAFWKEYNLAMISACTHFAVLTLPGWLESKGVAGEIEIAKRLNMPISYVHWGENRWNIAQSSYWVINISGFREIQPFYGPAHIASITCA